MGRSVIFADIRHSKKKTVSLSKNLEFLRECITLVFGLFMAIVKGKLYFEAY
jgi:hypothetical protein